MPIYEYCCQECSNEFEALVIGSEKASCPACNSRDLRRKMSTFAHKGSGSDSRTGGSSGGGCSGCQASSCASCH